MAKKTDYEKGWDDCYKAFKNLYRDNARQIRNDSSAYLATVKGHLKDGSDAIEDLKSKALEIRDE